MQTVLVQLHCKKPSQCSCIVQKSYSQCMQLAALQKPSRSSSAVLASASAVLAMAYVAIRISLYLAWE